MDNSSRYNAANFGKILSESFIAPILLRNYDFSQISLMLLMRLSTWHDEKRKLLTIIKFVFALKQFLHVCIIRLTWICTPWWKNYKLLQISNTFGQLNRQKLSDYKVSWAQNLSLVDTNTKWNVDTSVSILA